MGKGLGNRGLSNCGPWRRCTILSFGGGFGVFEGVEEEVEEGRTGVDGGAGLDEVFDVEVVIFEVLAVF